MIMKGTNIKPHLISEIIKTCSANCDLSTKFNNSQRQNEDSLPAAFFYTGVGLVWSTSCAHVFAAQEKELPHRKKNCRWTTAKVSLLGWIIFSMMLGKRLIMTGALEVFQCHHHGRMTGDDRETRKRHIFPISASALNCIIVQFDRRYQISMTGAEIEDEAMDVKYCEPGSNWSVVA